MPVAYPQDALRNLPSARCLRDVCYDRLTRTSARTITPWEIWFLPDLLMEPGELTIAVAAPLRQMRPLVVTDRRIMVHRQHGEFTTQLPTEHREWTWDQIADISRKGLRGIRVRFRDGTDLDVVDRSRAGAKDVVRRAQAALDVFSRGDSLTEHWQQITGITPRRMDPRLEALEFLRGRDGSSVAGEATDILARLEPDEVPLAAQRWDKGLALDTRGTDQTFMDATRIWVMTDRRFLEMQGEMVFRVRRQWPAAEVRGARLGDPARRTPDVVVIGGDEIPTPDSPRTEPPRPADVRFVSAINEAAQLVRRG
jgi:hypothetical protein